MKKIVTFSNFMVLLGIMTILFYLIPAVTIAANGEARDTAVNLFTATFGGAFTIDLQVIKLSYNLQASAGLVVAFVLGLVGILFSIAKVKVKYANLIACPFYLASGILVAFSSQLVFNANANVGIPNTFTYSMAPGAITVATFFCILGGFALIDFIASVAKPKQVNPAY